MYNQNKTDEEFKLEIYNLVGDEYTFLEQYKGSTTSIKVRHNSDLCNNHEYYVTPHNFTSNQRRCPICAKLKRENSLQGEVQNYTNDDLIKLIKDKYEEIGRVPRRQDMKNPDYTTYIQAFGSWKQCIISAGIDENFSNSRLYIEPYRTNTLNKLIEEYRVNSPLSAKEIKKLVPHKLKTLYKSFKCDNLQEFNLMLEDKLKSTIDSKKSNEITHNLKKNSKWNAYDKDIVIEEIIKFSINSGKQVNVADITKIPNIPTYHGIQSLFNLTWGNLTRRLDLKMQRLKEFTQLDEKRVLHLLSSDIDNLQLFSLSRYSLKKPKQSFAAIYYYKRFNIEHWQELIELINKFKFEIKQPTVAIKSKVYAKKSVPQIDKDKDEELSEITKKEDINKENNIINENLEKFDDKQKDILVKLKDKYLERKKPLRRIDVKESTKIVADNILELFFLEDVKGLNQLILDTFPEIYEVDLTQKYIKLIKENYQGNIDDLVAILGKDIADKIQKYFISWNNALKQAGFRNEIKGYSNYTDKEKSDIIQNLIVYALINESSIHSDDVSNIEGIEDYRSLEFIFNMRWRSLKKQLDLSLSQAGKFSNSSNREVLATLRKDYNKNKLQNLFTYSMNKPESSFPAIHFFKKFNIKDWDKFVQDVLDYKDVYRRIANKTKNYQKINNNRYSKENLILAIQQKAQELNRTPYGYEMKDIPMRWFYKFFGTYAEAVKEAGLQPTPNNINSLIDGDEIERIFERLKKQYLLKNKRVTINDLSIFSGHKGYVVLKSLNTDIHGFNKMLEEKYPELCNFNTSTKNSLNIETVINESKNGTYIDALYITIDKIIRHTLRNGNILDENNISNIVNKDDVLPMFNTTLEGLKFYLDTAMIRQQEFNSIDNETLTAQLKDIVIRYNIKSLSDYSLKRPINSFAAIYYYKRFYIQDWDKFIELICE